MKKIFIIAILLFVVANLDAAETKWKDVDDGIKYTAIRTSPGLIHAFKISPKKYKLGVVTAKGMGKKNASVKSMAKKKGALLAINGGFFTPDYESLGLIIDNGKILNPIKGTSWWSVFYMRGNTPRIVHTKSFQKSSSINMAIQSGPRLVVNGAIPKLKPSIAERSAVCVSRDGQVVLIATQNLLIEPKKFAETLRKSESKGGLACRTALNLDGGSSTQMYADVNDFELSIPGINRVANAVAVYRK